MNRLHNMILLHVNAFDEYTWWSGRWVYRRTVDFRHVTLQ
ncbi:hypothetical protein J2801_003617 [Paraburkholderia phenoliruptrix]|nr:hypothetical protein [Paraburkholderia phenoliruptrix]